LTTEDINNSKKIFGADMSSFRGKLTRHKSTPVREEVTEIPEELILQDCKIDLCIDILYNNKCGFMTTIDQTIRFRSALPIENRTHEEYYTVYWTWYCDCITAQLKQYIATENSAQYG
jgi:hypothetical protein